MFTSECQAPSGCYPCDGGHPPPAPPDKGTSLLVNSVPGDSICRTMDLADDVAAQLKVLNLYSSGMLDYLPT